MLRCPIQLIRRLARTSVMDAEQYVTGKTTCTVEYKDIVTI
jgi:hypothetical protein